MARVAELVAEMSLNTARLQADVGKATSIMSKGMKQMSSDVAMLKNMLASVVSVGALTALAKSAIDMGSALNDASKKYGVSASELSKFQYVAKMSGVEFEGLGNAFKFLNKSIAESADPSSKAAIAFKALGVTQKDLKEKSPQQIFEILADRFSELKDGANKTALALELFGRSGADILPVMAEGAAGIKRLGDEAVNLGIALSEDQIKKLDDYGDALDRLAMRTKSAAGQILIYMEEMGQKTTEFWYTTPWDAYLKRQGVAYGKLSDILVPTPKGEPTKAAPSIAGAGKSSSGKSAADALKKEAEEMASTWGKWVDEKLSLSAKAEQEAWDLTQSVIAQENDAWVALAEERTNADYEAQAAYSEMMAQRMDLERQYSEAIMNGDRAGAIEALNAGLAEQIRLQDEASNAAAAYIDVYSEAMKSAEDMAINAGMGIRDSFISNLTAAAMQAQTLGEAMKSLGKDIVGMLVQTFLKWVVNRTIMAAMGKTFAAAETAQAIAFGATAAKALAPAAAFMEIITLGGATAPAMTGLGLTVAFAESLAIPALEEGGIVPATPGGRLVRVAEGGKDEAIIPLDQAGSGGTTINLYMNDEILCTAVARGIRQGRLNLVLA